MRLSAVVTKRLLTWFSGAGRKLPWRETRDPYRILVSEVMLQQTQASRVVGKYLAFTERFPDFAALAASTPAQVLTLWSGLGYNSRGLRLRELARLVVERHGGELPSDYAALRALPGIGHYTACAVRAFAFEADDLAIDVNLQRVLARLYGREEVPVLAARGEGWATNHALMDFESLLCTRREPRCGDCPLRRICKTRGVSPFEKAATKQKPFLESDRYIRGSVLKALVKHGVLDERRLFAEMPDRVQKKGKQKFREILRKLLQEKLIVEVATGFSLPTGA